MEKIQFDSGMREFDLNGMGVLRFNPGDPNLYARFSQAGEKIAALEQELVQKAQQEGASPMELLCQADSQMKEILGWIFGKENNFDQVLGGVNLLAIAGNGERVVSNLLAALEPVLVAGAKAVAGEKTQQAVTKARKRRQAVQ